MTTALLLTLVTRHTRRASDIFQASHAKGLELAKRIEASR